MPNTQGPSIRSKLPNIGLSIMRLVGKWGARQKGGGRSSIGRPRMPTNQGSGGLMETEARSKDHEGLDLDPLHRWSFTWVH